MAVVLSDVLEDCKQFYNQIMDQKDPTTEDQMYSDLNEWIYTKYKVPDNPEAGADQSFLAVSLKDLYRKVNQVLGIGPEDRSPNYPPFALGGISSSVAARIRGIVVCPWCHECLQRVQVLGEGLDTGWANGEVPH